MGLHYLQSNPGLFLSGPRRLDPEPDTSLSFSCARSTSNPGSSVGAFRAGPQDLSAPTNLKPCERLHLNLKCSFHALRNPPAARGRLVGRMEIHGRSPNRSYVEFMVQGVSMFQQLYLPTTLSPNFLLLFSIHGPAGTPRGALHKPLLQGLQVGRPTRPRKIQS